MKKAVSLIELIIAIIIMGISVVSVPMLIDRGSNASIMQAIRQENVQEAFTNSLRVLVYNWDKNSYANSDEDQGLNALVILKTNSSNSFFNDRKGLTEKTSRKKSPSDKYATQITRADIGSIEEVGNFSDLNFQITDANRAHDRSSAETDYLIKDAFVSHKVCYMDDRFDGVNFNNQNIQVTFDVIKYANCDNKTNLSNIKHIVTATNSTVGIDGDELREQVILHAFSFNVGQAKPMKPTKIN